MEERVAEPVQIMVPYFFFREIRNANTLCMFVYINSSKFPETEFTLNENELSISSSVYKKKQYMAKILLPVKVVQSSDTPLDVHREENSHFKLYFEMTSLPEKRSPPLDLDLISCHVAWRDKTFREPPDTMSIDDMTNALEALTLNEAKSRMGHYGFACRHTNKMELFQSEWNSALELPDPDNTDPQERRLLRWSAEREAFDLEHYTADFFFQSDPEGGYDLTLESMLLFKPYWNSMTRATECKLSTHYMTLLAGLPSINFDLRSDERLEVLHSLFDIILAYAYDFRRTSGEADSESCWCISKLSATLSWFQVHRHVGDACDSFMRRSLTYPVCRHWTLSKLVYKDALEIFNLGRRQLLNCLLHIHAIFEGVDESKFLNELYIDDYLIWIQQVHPKSIKNYITHIESCANIRKENVFAHLPEIEEQLIEELKNSPFEYNDWYQKHAELWKTVRDRRVNKNSLSDESSDEDDSLSNSDATVEECSDGSSIEEESVAKT